MTKREGRGSATSAPSTHLFFQTPVFGGQNAHFQKNKCRPILTALKFADQNETPTSQSQQALEIRQK